MQIMFKQKDKFCKVGYKTKCRTYEIPCFFHHRNSYPRRFLTFLSNDPILSKNFFTLSVPWNNNCLFQKTFVWRREHNEDWIHDFKNMGEQKIVLSCNLLIEKKQYNLRSWSPPCFENTLPMSISRNSLQTASLDGIRSGNFTWPNSVFFSWRANKVKKSFLNIFNWPLCGWYWKLKYCLYVLKKICISVTHPVLCR